MPCAVIIPARFASSRFPGKPLHHIAGKPLVQHVWERCRLTTLVDRILVATDDPRIASTASAFGAEVVMTSPHHQSGTDRIAEAAHALPDHFDIINVQGDEPLINPALVDDIARGHAAVLLRMLSLLPSLHVTTRRTPLADGVFVVELTVENRGGLPTHGPTAATTCAGSPPPSRSTCAATPPSPVGISC